MYMFEVTNAPATTGVCGCTVALVTLYRVAFWRRAWHFACSRLLCIADPGNRDLECLRIGGNVELSDKRARIVIQDRRMLSMKAPRYCIQEIYHL